MFLSKRPNGIWYIFYDQPNGKRSCISTKSKIKSEALKFLSNFDSQIKERKQLKVIPIDFQTFKTDFLKYSETIHRPKTTKLIKAILTEFSDFTDNPQLYEINNRIVEQYLQEKIKVSPHTAQQHLAYLSSIFNKAISDGYLKGNPCKEIKKFRIPERQPLFFSEADFEILLRNVENKDLRDLFVFAVNTGLRQMELLNLEWRQINFKDKYLILDNSSHITKSKKIRTIPLNLTALQILTDREQAKNCELVFLINGNRITQTFISHKFKEFVKRSGLNPKLKFHSLRHTFASWLVQKGVSIFEVSKLMGHSDIRVTEIYSHLRAEDLMNSVNKLNN